MDTPGIEQTPAQIAAKERVRAAFIAHSNVLANRENYSDPADFEKDLAALEPEELASSAEYEKQFGL